MFPSHAGTDASGDGDRLTRAVTAAIAGGARGLWQVVGRCNGADPITVANSLRALGHEAIAANRYPDDSTADDAAVDPSLPLPHPLGFEWRFSRSGARIILQRALALGGGDLLLLGATTVALEAAKASWSGRLVAVEQSRQITTHVSQQGLPITVLTQPIFGQRLLDVPVSIVVADPPWYVADAKSFLSTAAACCKERGHVLVVLPGEGTRPEVVEEEAVLRTWCANNGLVLKGVQRQAVAYETPFFEANAFRAAGVAPVPRFWRRGDLWILQRRGTLPASVATVATSLPWHELSLLRMRTWFSPNRTHVGSTALTSLVDGDILPTVSRRDPRRQGAALWTSGNRVFACGDPQLLFTAISTHLEGRSIMHAGEQFLGRVMTQSEATDLAASCARVLELHDVESHEYHSAQQRNA